MNAQKTQRLAELEAINTEKDKGSKSTWRNWTRSNEFFEMIDLRTELANEKIAAKKKSPPSNAWRNDPATEKQIAYLRNLGIAIESGMTKGRASDLIEMHKADGSVGSLNGWYKDGSN